MHCEAFLLYASTCKCQSLFNWGGDKHLNHFMLCIGALTTFRGWSHRDPVLSLSPFAGSSGSVNTPSILAGKPFPFKSSAWLFSSLLVLGFSIVLVLERDCCLGAAKGQRLCLPGCSLRCCRDGAVGWLIVLFQICRYGLSSAIKREF